MVGWIKLHRELIDKPIWQSSSPEQKTIFITLLLMANHYENEWEWKGENYKAKPGQFVTSLPSIVKKCGKGITTQNVRTALVRFEKYDFLTDESTNKNRLITITNWDLYQQPDNEPNSQPNRQLTGNQQATNRQLTAKKECKNDKNKRNIYSDLPEELHQPLSDYIESRKKLKKPMTDRAVELMLKKLNKLSDGDIQKSIAILEQSVLQGWIGIFELKEESKKKTGTENPFDELLKEELLNEQSRNYCIDEDNQRLLPGLLSGQGDD